MEKRVAHYSLVRVQAMVVANAVRITRTALEGAASMGYSFDDVIEVLKNLQSGDLLKSMTSHHDHTVWQDVYRYPAEDVDIYLKIQIVRDVVVVSFKEL